MTRRKTKMKKLFIPIISLLAVTSLVGCNSNSESTISSSSSEPTSSTESSSSESKVDYSDLKIVCPSGAPALALYDMYASSNVDINASADNVASYLSPNSDKDIVIAPTNLVVSKVIKGGAPFKLAGVITFGNFYIAATGNDDNDTFDKDDYIVLFQANGLPGKLFNYTYGSDYNTHPVDAASNAAACLISGVNVADNNASVDYVLVPQPALTPALQKAKTTRTAVADKIKVVKNVQEDYRTKSGNNDITQASIFVKATTDHTQRLKVGSFLYDVSKKLEAIKADQTDLDVKLGNLEDTALQAKFGAPNLTILKKVVKENSVNIGYEVGIDYKSSIDSFLKNLGFTDEDTSEELYW